MPFSSLRAPARRFYGLAASLMMMPALVFLTAGAAPAADDLSPAPAGSLDSMWSEQPGDPPTASTAPTAVAPTSAITSAPMCNLETFKLSALVAKGAWPGIGPFKGSGLELRDDASNQLTIKTAE